MSELQCQAHGPNRSSSRRQRASVCPFPAGGADLGPNAFASLSKIPSTSVESKEFSSARWKPLSANAILVRPNTPDSELWSSPTEVVIERRTAQASHRIPGPAGTVGCVVPQSNRSSYSTSSLLADDPADLILTRSDQTATTNCGKIDADTMVANTPCHLEQKRNCRANRRASMMWAMLMARIFEVMPLSCPHCGQGMKIISFITQKKVIQKILGHLGLPTEPPTTAPARAPPQIEIKFSEMRFGEQRHRQSDRTGDGNLFDQTHWPNSP